MRRSGEDERWREGAADRKLWKERTERVAIFYLTLTPVQQGTRRKRLYLTLTPVQQGTRRKSTCTLSYVPHHTTPRIGEVAPHVEAVWTNTKHRTYPGVVNIYSNNNFFFILFGEIDKDLTLL